MSSFSQIEILVVGPLLPALMDALESTFQVHKLWALQGAGKGIATIGGNIRALVTSFVHGADAALLESLPNLEMIASYGVGLDRIDLDTVRRRNLLLTNTPDISEPVADTAMALLLAVTRRLCQADSFVKAGRWAKEAFPFGVELRGKTCGIVGLGRIGRAVARRAEAFGMKIAYHGPNAKSDAPYPYYRDLTALAMDSDALVLALPGGEQTWHLVDERVLSALGPKGFLINVARGSVLDEAALIRKLKAGELAGAGLDVFEQEPLGESPLMELENVVLLPHIGSATTETRHAMGDTVLANLKAHFSGEKVLTPA